MLQPPQVNKFDPAFKANPYPTYAQLRSSAPIYRVTLASGRGVWLITRYDVAAVLKDELSEAAGGSGGAQGPRHPL